MIQEYFGVPILIHNIEGDQLDQIQNQITAAIPEIKKMDLSNPWDDTMLTTFKFGAKNNILDEFKLDLLKDEFLFRADMMTRGHFFNIQESWFNFSYKGNFQFDHTHGGSKLSGVYYYKATGTEGNIKFKNPNLNEHLGLGLNSHTKWLFSQPIVGRMIIFPSYIEHRVDPNLTDNERISITVNLI